MIGGHLIVEDVAGEAEHVERVGPMGQTLYTGVQQASTDMTKVEICTVSRRSDRNFPENIPPPTPGLSVKLSGLFVEENEGV